MRLHDGPGSSAVFPPRGTALPPPPSPSAAAAAGGGAARPGEAGRDRVTQAALLPGPVPPGEGGPGGGSERSAARWRAVRGV